MRTFEGGATRDDDDVKCDYEGFLSPLVIERYGEYMNKHRVQADGEVRDSDNWQKGIPISVYMKSWWRHFVEAWVLWRRLSKTLPAKSVLDVNGLEALSDSMCATLFNNMGMLHEIEKELRLWREIDENK